MVLFEDVEFIPFGIDKFKNSLTNVLLEVENEFLQKMFPYFGYLLNPPQPIEIKLYAGLPEFNIPNKRIRIPFSPYNFTEDRCLDSLRIATHSCAHESGHYLHYFTNKEFFKQKIPNYTEIKRKKDRDIYLLREVVAELGALAFFDISNREFSNEVISHRQHLFNNSVYDFYLEKGRDYCLKKIKNLATLHLTERDYKDILDIGRRGWIGRPRIK